MTIQNPELIGKFSLNDEFYVYFSRVAEAQGQDGGQAADPGNTSHEEAEGAG